MLNRQAQSLEEKVTKFVKCTQRRNTREILVASVLIAVFASISAYDIYRQNENTLSIVGSGVIIFALLLNLTIIKWKLRIPKSDISAFPPARFPDKWKHHLTYQARLLKLAWLWYLLPLFLGLCIYLLSVCNTFSLSLIILFVFEGAVFIAVLSLEVAIATLGLTGVIKDI